MKMILYLFISKDRMCHSSMSEQVWIDMISIVVVDHIEKFDIAVFAGNLSSQLLVFVSGYDESHDRLCCHHISQQSS